MFRSDGEMVDTRDLKSLGSNPVLVRVQFRAAKPQAGEPSGSVTRFLKGARSFIWLEPLYYSHLILFFSKFNGSVYG